MSGAHVERQGVQIGVPLSNLMVTGAAGAVMAREAAGQYSLSLPTAAGAYVVGIPLDAVLPMVPTSNVGIDRLGFKLEEIILWHAIGAVNLSAHSFRIDQESIIGNAARAAATSFGGTLTYDVDDGTASALPTTQRAGLYKTRVILGTPAYITTRFGKVTAEWAMTTGAATGTAKVHGIVLQGRQGIYY